MKNITISVYLTNLGKYNEGELVGQWVELDGTLEYSDLKEGGKCDIGLNSDYEEYFITDFESPVEINEYTSIDRLNEIYKTLTEIQEETNLEECEIEAILKEISLEELHEGIHDLFIYPDCNDMSDVAYNYIEQTGLLHGVPDSLQRYFDYDAFGRDMGYEGHYIFTDNNTCIQII